MSSGFSWPFIALRPIAHQRRAHHVTDAFEAAFHRSMRAVARRCVAAMPLQRIDGVEKAAERIVDLVGHAGRQAAEACEPLFLGELWRRALRVRRRPLPAC